MRCTLTTSRKYFGEMSALRISWNWLAPECLPTSPLASLDWVGVRVAQLAQSRWIWFCQELWNCTGLRVWSFSASWLV